MLRLFLGIALPGPLRDRIATVLNGIPEARWIHPADAHITLRFIGEVPEDSAEELDGQLRVTRLPGGPLTLRGFDTFSTKRGVRALFIPVLPTPALLALHDKCETVCQQTGLPTSRERYHPHVTLARFSPPATGRVEQVAAANTDWPGGTFTPSHLTLFRSHLGRSGPLYEELAAYPLSPESGQTG